MNSIEYLDVAKVDYSGYIESSHHINNQVGVLSIRSVVAHTESLFGMGSYESFSSLSPPLDPPSESCFGYELLPIDIDKAIKVIDEEGVDEEKLLDLLYNIEYLNSLSREIAHRRDSILAG